MSGAAWLVVAELGPEGSPTPGSLALVAWAAARHAEVEAAVCGQGAAAAAADLLAQGARRVHVADDARLGPADSQPHVDALAPLVRGGGHELVLLESTSLSSAVAGGLAARLGCGVNWDLVDVAGSGDALCGTRLALGDSVAVTVGWQGGPARLALLRPGACGVTGCAAGGLAAAGEVVSLAVELEPWSASVQVLAETAWEDAGGVAIEDAGVLVAGGCGLRSAADLALLGELADALGGAVAVTMPLVDRRWGRPSAQVGQTGRTVAPKAYIACGISGAVQHRVGMQGAEAVVVINSDPGAPFFEHADLGVVGDLYEVVPALTALLRARG